MEVNPATATPPNAAKAAGLLSPSPPAVAQKLDSFPVKVTANLSKLEAVLVGGHHIGRFDVPANALEVELDQGSIHIVLCAPQQGRATDVKNQVLMARPRYPNSDPVCAKWTNITSVNI